MNLRRRLQNYIALNNYVEAFRSNILPNEYTQLEYIESSGTQYIDTGILLSNTDTFEITFQSALNTLTSPVMGAISGGAGYTSTNNLCVTYTTSSGLNDYAVYCDGNAGNAQHSWNGGNASDKLKHTIKYNGLNIAPTIDGVDMAQLTPTTLVANAPTVTTWLFGRNNTSTGTLSQNGIRIYNVNIQGKGHFIPAKRNSDNVIGMYDTVSDRFFTNQGTGNFIAGPDTSKTISGNKIYLEDSIKDSLSSLNVYGKTIQSNIPEGYTELEYIETSGTQYINLDVRGNATFIGTAQSTTDSPTTSQVLFANSGAAAGHWFGIQSPGAGSSYAKRWGLGATPTASSTIDGTTKVNFEITFTQTSQTGTVNDQTLTRESSAITHTDWIAFVGNTSLSYGFIGKIWKLKVVQNDALVRNLIPAKNSSNVIGMYDTVSGQFFTNDGTGTFTAGPTAVPSPDAPVDIVSNNGVLKVSPNLFNKDLVPNENKYIIASRGTANTPSSSEFRHSDYITIKENTQYYVGIVVSPANAAGLAFYDDTKTYISGLSLTQLGDANNIITSPNNAKYIRFSFKIDEGYNTDWENTVYFVEGNQPLAEFIPYGQIYTDGTVETINIKGNNLYDITKDVNDKYIDANGNIGDDTSLRACYSDLIPVKSGEMYTYSGICKSSSGTSNAKRIHGYIDGVWNQQIQILNIDINKTFSNTFTIPAGINGIRISHWKDDENTQVEECYRPTKYNNYIDMNLDVANLLSVGDYKDEQEILSGTITRNVGVKVLDGTENWFVVTNYSNLYGLVVADGVFASNKLPMSTHYQGTTANNSFMPNDTIKATTATILAPNKVSVYIKDGANSTLAGFKQYLATQYAAGTPVIVIYPLAEPTTETTTAQTTLLASNNNVITRDSKYMNNLGLDLTYKKLR